MSNNSSRTLALVTLIAIAAALRVLPHLPNFTPVAGLALVGGAYFARPILPVVWAGSWARLGLAILVPLAALFVSDLALGFHSQAPSVYASFILVAVLGFWTLEKRSAGRIAGVSVASSLIFFLITNLTVWAEGLLYPRSLQGLVDCYVLALPFLRNSLAGDLFYSAVLFGLWAWMERLAPAALKEAR